MIDKLLLDDAPVCEKGLLLEGLRDLAEQLVGILKEDTLNFPILVSGDWGAGKTSLLKSIREELEKEERFPVIWFEAWHYEKTDGLLPALMRQVWEKTPKKFRNKKTAKKLAGNLWRSAFAATTLSIPAVLKAFGVPLLPELIMKVNSKTVGDVVEATPGFIDSEPSKDAGDELWENLNALIDTAWPSGETPIVFIDDLDRCTPDGTIQLLDAVKMLMSKGEKNSLKLRFVVALDQTIAVRAISTKFAGIRDYDGNRYLEKLFPIGFHITPPNVRDSAHLIQNLLEAFKHLTQDHKDCLLEALSNPAFANPRLMKRSINKFILACRQERKAQEENQTPGTGDISDSARMARNKYLAKWIAATARWPQLRSLVQKRDISYWEQFLEAVKSGDEKKLPGPDAVGLMTQPGAKAWMQTENFPDAFGGFKQAELRLSRYGL